MISTISSASVTAASVANAVISDRGSSMVNIVGMVTLVHSPFVRLPDISSLSALIRWYNFFFQQSGETRNIGDIKPRITEEANDKSKVWKLTEISEQSQCRSLRLPENMRVHKVLISLQHLHSHILHSRKFLQSHAIFIIQISKLIYTNSGSAILALASNAIHLLWKWQRGDRNSSGKVLLEQFIDATLRWLYFVTLALFLV